MDKIFRILKQAINICEESKIGYWVVGGFAVDAKRGFISREHGDIDLCIMKHDLDKSLRNFFKNGFRVTKEGMKYVFYKSGVKIDIFVLFPEGDYYGRKREWFEARYPREMFDNFQIMSLNSLRFRIPSNEGLRYYGSKTTHDEDKPFTESLPFDIELFSKIEYKEFADYKESIKNVKIEELRFDM